MLLVQHLTNHALWSTALRSRLVAPEQVSHLSISCNQTQTTITLQPSGIRADFEHSCALSSMYPDVVRSVTFQCPNKNHISVH